MPIFRYTLCVMCIEGWFGLLKEFSADSGMILSNYEIKLSIENNGRCQSDDSLVAYCIFYGCIDGCL